jgi:hypothetical protein
MSGNIELGALVILLVILFVHVKVNIIYIN